MTSSHFVFATRPLSIGIYPNVPSLDSRLQAIYTPPGSLLNRGRKVRSITLLYKVSFSPNENALPFRHAITHLRCPNKETTLYNFKDLGVRPHPLDQGNGCIARINGEQAYECVQALRTTTRVYVYPYSRVLDTWNNKRRLLPTSSTNFLILLLFFFLLHV